ncbi:DNA replication complex GINS protein psf3-like [Tripterygium wilfordii]|uniref:DNA replication complex GINS protein psf3-like n=1 Tax=Tripterygium wilfordii TaxID=458696 RepID=UPI0018F82699|nr:DNA replication complex GINS protein psf3-like [Tripterygium wilfordii]
MVNYYDIDDILTVGEFVPMDSRKEVNRVKIDDSVEKGFVEAGSRWELLFWLVKELHLRQAVSMNIPACFNQKYNVVLLISEHGCVDFRSRCPYFYGFGCKIAPLCEQTIGCLLLSAFKIRYEIILCKARTAVFSASSKLSMLLTEEETDMYEAAQSSMAAFKKWRIGGPRFQKESILGKKKKKFIETTKELTISFFFG